jgi:uncharacterized protein YbjT (DUF2867 family)
LEVLLIEHPKPSAVFVAGATGLTGRAVVARLCKRQIPVVAHVRPDSARLDEWKEHFSSLGAEVDTTAWDEVAMSEAMKKHKPEWVFALLGTTRARSKASAKQGVEESYMTVDYGMTVLLARALTHAGLRPGFVYLSSIGVHADSQNSYIRARYLVEQFLEESPLPYIIARPSFILGNRDQDRPMERVGAFFGDNLLRLAGFLGAKRLQHRYQSLTNEELAEALIRLAEDPDTRRQTFERHQFPL